MSCGNLRRKLSTPPEHRDIEGTLFTTGYAYDVADNVTAVTYPSGRVVSYLRDSLGRVSEVKSRPNAGGTDVSLASNIAYKPFGPVKGLTYGNALVLARTFDQDYRLTAQSVTAGAVTAQDLTYGYDLASFITAVNDNRPTAIPAGGLNETYLYGANDNRLISVTGGASARSFTYTNAGHVTGDGTLGFTIDNSGRNVEAKLNGTTLATYTHNALGQRVKKAIPAGAVTLFHYAASGQLLATSDGAGADWTEYAWLGAMPIAQIDAGTIHYTHADHLGAPQALTDSTQAIVWDASFRPFGQAESLAGTVAQALRFPGQYFDAETGTHYNYFRDYDPSLGRYLSSDPIGLAGGLNTYAYVGGNPEGAVDPLGLESLLGGGGIGANPENATTKEAMVALSITLSPLTVLAKAPAALAGGFDLAYQVLVEGKSLRCVNWSEVFVATALGAVGQGVLSNLGKLNKGSMKAANAIRRFRRQNKVPSSYDVHHWGIKINGPIGRHVPDAIKNHPLNLNPIPRNVHRRIHGNSPQKSFGPVRRWWHGHPGWSKDLEGAAGLAAAGLALPEGGGCGCRN